MTSPTGPQRRAITPIQKCVSQGPGDFIPWKLQASHANKPQAGLPSSSGRGPTLQGKRLGTKLGSARAQPSIHSLFICEAHGARLHGDPPSGSPMSRGEGVLEVGRWGQMDTVVLGEEWPWASRAGSWPRLPPATGVGPQVGPRNP